MIREPLLLVSRATPFHGQGGMEHAAWDLATALTHLGLRVNLLTTRVPGRPPLFEHDGVEVRALEPAPPGRYSGAWWEDSRLCFRSHYAGRVAGVLSVSAGAYGLLRDRPPASEVPFVFQAHGTAWRDFVSKWRRPRPRPALSSLRNLAWVPRDLSAYHRFDAIAAVGASIAEEFRRPPIRWALSPARVVVIPNGVDTARFAFDAAGRRSVRAAHALAPDAWVVISAARLHAQKGLDLALDGFARLARRDPRAHYVIVGEGPDGPRLRERARTLGIAERVVFAGACSRQRMAQFLSAGDVFLFTTLHREGAPLSLLEALACGLPVVLSRHLEEPLRWGPAVRGVDPRNPGEIAVALEERSTSGATRLSLLPPGHALNDAAQLYVDLFERLRRR